MTRVELYLVLLVVCCGYALLRGGAPERLVAAILVVNVALTFATISDSAIRYRHIEVSVMIIDACSLVGVTAIALLSARYWPLWMTAFYVLQVLSHLVPLLPHMLALIYGIMVSICAYPVLLLLAAGAWRHQKRLAQTGNDASWATSSG